MTKVMTMGDGSCRIGHRRSPANRARDRGAAGGSRVCGGNSRNRSLAPGQDLAREIEARGGRAAVLQADLADAAAVAGLMESAGQALGPVTLLVNNASEFQPDDVETLGEAQWDRHFAVNLRAPAFCPATSHGSCLTNSPARSSTSSISGPEAHAPVLLLHADEGGPLRGHALAGARPPHPRECRRTGSDAHQYPPGR